MCIACEVAAGYMKKEDVESDCKYTAQPTYNN